jgi:ketosteroid isomerase-like protein
MRRTSVFVTIALLAGCVIGYFARSAAGMLQRRTNAADLAGIEKLNQEDIEATLAQDPKRLIDGWAEDAVAFFPGRPPAVGKQAIWKVYAQSPRMKVWSYTSTYKNLQVDGGFGLGMRVVRKESRVSSVSEVPADRLAR